MTNIKHLLVIGSVWPEPVSSAAGRRMMQLIKVFQSVGWAITFVSPSGKSARAADLSPFNIQTASININDSSVDSFLVELQPTAVLFDRFVTEEQFGWRVAEQCPRALRILDTEDLHCLRRARRKALDEDRSFSYDDLLTDQTAKREVASIYRCDCSFIISEFEMDLLKNVFGMNESLLQYLPFLTEPMNKADLESMPAFERRNHFMTIGNFRHAPNWDSVQYLHETIWPLIRKQLPNAEMHVYGSYPSQQAMALHQPEKRFLIKGWAELSREVLKNSRICLAPLRFGAGLKGKLVEAMQCGTPSITTSIGAEGIAGPMKWSGTVADEPEDLADAAFELYSDKLRWERAQQQGFKIINERFDKKLHIPAFLGRIEQISDRLKLHRQQNFMGSMLMHHSMAGTKYMSKWIEEKNKE